MSNAGGCSGTVTNGTGCMECVKCLMEMGELMQLVNARVAKASQKNMAATSEQTLDNFRHFKEFDVTPGDKRLLMDSALGLTSLMVYKVRGSGEGFGQVHLEDYEEEAYQKALRFLGKQFDEGPSNGVPVLKKVEVEAGKGKK